MWSMVMNARSDGPDAAWEFMEWASGSAAAGDIDRLVIRA
jgi:hypothetical protein